MHASQAVWLDSSLVCYSLRPRGSTANPALHDQESGKEVPVDSLACSVLPQPVDFLPGRKGFVGEVYWLATPQAIGCEPMRTSAFITAPWPLHWMLATGDQPNNKWTCRHIGTNLPAWMSICGFPAQETFTRPSKKSAIERLRRHNHEVPARLVLSREEEFSLSCPALVVWVSTWGANAQLRGWGTRAKAMVENAKGLLHVVVEFCLDDGAYDIAIGGVSLVIRKRSVSLAALTEASEVLGRRLEKHPSKHGEVRIADLLIELAGSIWKAGEAKQKDECKRFFVGLTQFLATAWEIKLSAFFREAHGNLYVDMPVLKGPSGKARRISAARKQAVVQAVAADPEVCVWPAPTVAGLLSGAILARALSRHKPITIT